MKKKRKKCLHATGGNLCRSENINKFSMKKIVIVFIIGISISILVSCFSTQHYLLKDFEFYGTELENPNETKDGNKVFRNVCDTLKNKIIFGIVSYGEYQYGYLDNVSLIEKCYATSVPEVLDNDIILEELELKFDSDIYFESEIIEKGTDLWNHPKLKNYKWFYKRDNTSPSYYAVIGFADDFYNKVHIPQKRYLIELTCKTSDSQIITKSIDLYLKI
jgi:hypothetical protein